MATSGAMSTSNEFIKYKITITEDSQDTAGNYSSVTVSVHFYRTNTGYETYGSGKVYCTIDGIKYTASVSSSQKITSSGIVLFKKTVKVYHDDDGSKDLKVSAYIDHSRFSSSSQSYTQTLTKIMRQSSLEVADGTLGTAQTLTVVQNNPDYTHTIKYTCGSVSGVICENSSATSISFTPLLSLASQNTTGATVSITYEIESFDDGVSVGTRTITVACAIPESVAPSCVLAVSDANGYADQFGDYIKGKSALSLLVTAEKAHDSNIVSYSIEADGSTYTAAEVTTEALKNAGELTITATVTDQRHRTGSASKTINVLDYAAPIISSLKVSRCNADGTSNSSGTYAKIVFSNEVTPLNNKNTAVYKLQYRKASESSYTSRALTAFAGVYSNSGATYIITSGLDTSATYEIILTIEDAFGSVSKTATCPSASKLWSILRKGMGFAFGKVAELEGVFEVAFQTKLTGGILHPTPDDGADLDTLTTPNTHRLFASRAYINAPEAEVNAVLKITGDSNALRQRFSVIDKANPRAYERAFYSGEWGAWVDLDAFMLAETKTDIAGIQTNMASIQIDIEALRKEMLLAAYPVGSIYMSLNETSPEVLFGGAWVRIEDRFLLAAGSVSAGTKDGAESYDLSVSHKHTAPVGYSSSAFGTININGTVSMGSGKGFRTVDTGHSGTLSSNVTGLYTSNATVSDTIPTMPPYLAVYVWQRIDDPIPENCGNLYDSENKLIFDSRENQLFVEVV